MRWSDDSRQFNGEGRLAVFIAFFSFLRRSIFHSENEKRRCSNIPSSVASPFEEKLFTIKNDRIPKVTSKDAENPLISQFTEIKEKEDCSSTNAFEFEEERYDLIQRSSSLPTIWIDARADKVYTIGCFDLFHEGHRILLQRMRQFGRQVIVGVHDSRSIQKLKSRVPVHGVETRMTNVKRYADQVYCVAGTDPSPFLTCIVHLYENETALYLRGDDMIDFPSKHVVEELMPIKFLPYTNGISTSELRQELFPHIKANDLEHLEKIN